MGRQALRTDEQPGSRALMRTTLYRLLPPAIRRWTTPSRMIVAVQLLRFGAVGTLGFVVDTATVYALRAALGLYGAGLAGYVTAASSNWVFNRIWTFRGQGSGSAHRQWALFMVVNLAGFVLNRGTYALLVTFVPIAADQPVIAVAAGAIAGLFTNFTLSRRLVFR
jgi:putative flippase GtrA